MLTYSDPIFNLLERYGVSRFEVFVKLTFQLSCADFILLGFFFVCTDMHTRVMYIFYKTFFVSYNSVCELVFTNFNSKCLTDIVKIKGSIFKSPR